MLLIAGYVALMLGNGIQPHPTSLEYSNRLRLLVLTDVSSLTAGMREPDDAQSMIRLMLYSNEFDIEGLIASSNLGHGSQTRPELIRQIICAYGEVRPNLLKHSKGYPTESYLLDRVKSGWPVAGRDIPIDASIGEGKDTEASRWIIQVVVKPDPRPVWITVWGGTADLAQALWRVRRDRTPEEVSAFTSKMRVIAVNDQDSTASWIRKEFPELQYITRTFGIRGMYRGGDTNLVSASWVDQHIIHGRGTLGALYPNYNGGDIWSGKLGPIKGIKEGDTPSYLSLIPNGLNDPDNLGLGGWGGRCLPGPDGPNRLVDAIEEGVGQQSDPAPQMSTVYRWRAAFQADFQARLEWCVKPHKEANHPPIARIAGPTVRRVRRGSTTILNASRSTDPDGNMLSYEWTVYPDADIMSHMVDIANPNAAITRVTVSDKAKEMRIPILLTVRDSGNPPLTRYRRVFLSVSGS
jgi:hypothetical protein